jgi:hypothetical protein
VLVRVQREVIRADGVVFRSENRYFISNESAGRFTPQQWLGVIRSHWRLENDAHKTLDVVLGEDDPPWIRDPHGMLVLEVIRHIACNAMVCCGSSTSGTRPLDGRPCSSSGIKCSSIFAARC